MQSEVRIRLNEASANFWSDDDIDSSLNEGLAELADATGFYERMTNISLLSNRTYIDLRDLVSDTFLAPKRAINTTTGKWLIPSTVRTQDRRSSQWEKTATEPEDMFMRGLWWIGFYPKPPQDDGLIRLYFTAIPPAMEDDTDEPEIPEEYHLGITAYAIYDLLAQDAETKKALFWWAEYQAYEAKLYDYVQGRIATDKVGQLGKDAC